MATTLETPDVDALGRVVAALGEWQHEGAAMQLHPGDLGWSCRFGVPAAAAAVRTWTRDGRLLAVGLLDGDDLLRVTTAPDARHDEELAQRVAADVSRPDRGVLGAGTVLVEAPADALLQDVLAEAGWGTDVPWTPLRRDLSEPVPATGLRVEPVDAVGAEVAAALLRSAFDAPSSSSQRWLAMAEGPGWTDARGLVGHDGDVPVAVVLVWSAGAGRPGLVEPMGVHADHRGRGHGTAITVAGAAALQELGASSALVCTPSAQPGAVATYVAAGFEARPEVRDRRRDALPVGS